MGMDMEREHDQRKDVERERDETMVVSLMAQAQRILRCARGRLAAVYLTDLDAVIANELEGGEAQRAIKRVTDALVRENADKVRRVEAAVEAGARTVSVVGSILHASGVGFDRLLTEGDYLQFLGLPGLLSVAKANICSVEVDEGYGWITIGLYD